MRFVSNDRVVSAQIHSLVEPPTKLEQNCVEILHERRCRNVKQKGHASSSSGVAGTGLPAIPGMPRPPFLERIERERKSLDADRELSLRMRVGKRGERVGCLRTTAVAADATAGTAFSRNIRPRSA